MARRHLLSWLAILGTSGCSFGLDGPARTPSRTEPPECSDSKGTVVLDGFVAVGTGIGALVALDNNAGEAGALLGATALLYTIAAVRGNGVVDRCRKAQDQFALANTQSDDEPPARQRRHTGPAAMAETPRPIAAPDLNPTPNATPDPTPDPSPRSNSSPSPSPSPSPNSTPSLPANPSAPKPSKPPTAPADEPDDWSAFWEEVR